MAQSKEGEKSPEIAQSHRIFINGVPILFPYSHPYVAQKQVMMKVVQSLSKKHNALLESPTGSGKSLAILCSALAWHKKNYPKDGRRHITITPDLPSKPSNDNSYNNTNNGPNLDKFKFNKTSPPNMRNNPKPQKPPKIIFTSRTHGQLQQLIAEYRRTPYYKDFQMVVLGSRKSLCINTKIQPLSDRNDQWYLQCI